ncbi:MAG: metallophosphoesterase [Pseudomonadota bacterium]
MAEPMTAAELPAYHGTQWVRPGLPEQVHPWGECWQESDDRDLGDPVALAEALQRSVNTAPWEWPARPLYFLADPHADVEAFVASLVASGGVKKTGPGDRDFELTDAGRRGDFIIGGDCLDKGPSDLRLLDSVRSLREQGARVRILGGNHDVRLLLGLRTLDRPRDPRTEHFFLRMGPKVVPLFREVHDRYPQDFSNLRGIPDERECRRRLYPSDRWFDEFPRSARGLMTETAVERELVRMRRKLEIFEPACAGAGLSLRQVYAVARQCRKLFLEPGGDYAWFFEDMKLAHREGSFLFIHAGIDDRAAAWLADGGVDHLNRLYREQVEKDPFEFYYGPLANTMRTKYREVDMPLTPHGVEKLHHRGIYAVVHGHRNRTSGQRLMLRKGMLHIESDITMDRNSRHKEGLDGYGAGVTIVRPEGQVLGISTDHPYARVFDPAACVLRDTG